MSTYVLVHGSWHGAWCWYKVVPRLERAGHRAIAIDLPGHGRNWRPPADVSMQDDVDAIAKVLDSLSEPAILVGRSRGGIAISQTAESRPDKIKTLVYLTAFLIPSGEPMLATALADAESLIVSNLILNEQTGWHMVKEEAFQEALYADCSDEDVYLARALLTPEPNAPAGTPLQLTNDHFGRVSRVYIECLQDRAISQSVQKKMYTATPCEKVISMQTSHSPFLSQPDASVGHLVSLAS